MELTSDEIILGEKAAELSCYNKRPFVAQKGEGVYLYDKSGKRYIDCVMGHGVGVIGHCHPKVSNAIAQQAKTLVCCPEVFPNHQRMEFEQELLSVAPGEKLRSGKVFLCNSGTEAMEAALKLARAFTKKKGFVCAMNAFHGRTTGSLALTFNPKYREPFEPLIGPVKRVRFGDIASLEAAFAQATEQTNQASQPYQTRQKILTSQTDQESQAIQESQKYQTSSHDIQINSNIASHDIAAVVLEPIQGEGGVRPPPAGYFKAVREICDKWGTLLIIDEIQTGFGRSGKMFAIEHFDCQADIVCMAKGIAGGVPCGAIIARQGIDFAPQQHGSTFGGNPLAASAGIASLAAIKDEKMCENAGTVGKYFLERLKEFETSKKLVREVRGKGLMVAIELKKPSKEYLSKLIGEGVLALPAGDMVLRFLPPLIITKEQVDEVVAALDRVLE
ncbi:aspartate aminotransferase family protein [Candidatus Parvarchaeota archaeon]|nr:aspartate aminotransferase family protein [Candidatus Parvarchaeota archaeon]